MSDSVRPHRRQPTRLRHPWDSPGKNTGVGCHCLLQCMKVKSESEDAQSYPTLSDPMDCSLPGSSVHGIFQTRVLEWVARVLEWVAIAIYLLHSRYLTDACVMKEHHWQRFQKCSCFLLGAWWRGGKEVSDLRSWSWGKKQESLYCLFVCFSFPNCLQKARVHTYILNICSLCNPGESGVTPGFISALNCLQRSTVWQRKCNLENKF